MKILINYDFFSEVQNARRPLTPLKVIKNHKIELATIHFPLCMAINMRSHSFLVSTCIYGIDLLFASGVLLVCDGFFSKTKDPYAKLAKERLVELTEKLRALNVNTDYECLLKASLYKKERVLELNKSKIPFILESKYILVPSYINGEVTKTSILEEHVVGSKEYVISVSPPTKRLKMVNSRLAY